MYGEKSFTSAERSKAAVLAENAGYMLDFIRRAPGSKETRMPSHDVWMEYLRQARRELANALCRKSDLLWRSGGAVGVPSKLLAVWVPKDHLASIARSLLPAVAGRIAPSWLLLRDRRGSLTC